MLVAHAGEGRGYQASINNSMEVDALLATASTAQLVEFKALD